MGELEELLLKQNELIKILDKQELNKLNKRIYELREIQRKKNQAYKEKMIEQKTTNKIEKLLEKKSILKEGE